MRVIAGQTVAGLRRRQERWRRFEDRALRVFNLTHAALEAAGKTVDRGFARAEQNFDDSVRRAIADRYAVINVAQKEIIELEQL